MAAVTDTQIRHLIEQLRLGDELASARLALIGERVVRFLAEAQQEPNIHIHLGIVETLRLMSEAGSEAGSAAAVEALVAALDDPYAEVRLNAADALLEKRAPEAKKAILALAHTWNEGVSAHLLASLEEPIATETLLRRLTDEDPFQVAGAIQALLLSRGEAPEIRTRCLQAIDSLFVYLERVSSEPLLLHEYGSDDSWDCGGLNESADENADLCHYLLETLVKTQVYTAPACRAALRSPGATVRRVAIDALCAMQDSEAGPLLLPLLQDSDITVRCHALRGLGILKRTEALPELVALLEAENALVTTIAVLASLGVPRAVAPLCRLVERRGYRLGKETAQYVMESLADFALPGVQAMAEMLRTGTPSTRRLAVFGLNYARHPAGREAVLAALEDTDPAVRREAFWGEVWLFPDQPEKLLNALTLSVEEEIPTTLLRDIREAQSVEHLSGLLLTGSEAVQAAAAQALSHTPDPRATETLLRVLTYTPENRPVVLALGRLQARGAVEMLLNTLASNPSGLLRQDVVLALSSKPPNVRSFALGFRKLAGFLC